jgi:hypothetical protein
VVDDGGSRSLALPEPAILLCFVCSLRPYRMEHRVRLLENVSNFTQSRNYEIPLIDRLTRSIQFVCDSHCTTVSIETSTPTGGCVQMGEPFSSPMRIT